MKLSLLFAFLLLLQGSLQLSLAACKRSAVAVAGVTVLAAGTICREKVICNGLFCPFPPDVSDRVESPESHMPRRVHPNFHQRCGLVDYYERLLSISVQYSLNEMDGTEDSSAYIQSVGIIYGGQPEPHSVDQSNQLRSLVENLNQPLRLLSTSVSALVRLVPDNHKYFTDPVKSVVPRYSRSILRKAVRAPRWMVTSATRTCTGGSDRAAQVLRTVSLWLKTTLVDALDWNKVSWVRQVVGELFIIQAMYMTLVLFTGLRLLRLYLHSQVVQAYHAFRPLLRAAFIKFVYITYVSLIKTLASLRRLNSILVPYYYVSYRIFVVVACFSSFPTWFAIGIWKDGVITPLENAVKGVKEDEEKFQAEKAAQDQAKTLEEEVQSPKDLFSPLETAQQIDAEVCTSPGTSGVPLKLFPWRMRSEQSLAVEEYFPKLFGDYSEPEKSYMYQPSLSYPVEAFRAPPPAEDQANVAAIPLIKNDGDSSTTINKSDIFRPQDAISPVENPQKLTGTPRLFNHAPIVSSVPISVPCEPKASVEQTKLDLNPENLGSLGSCGALSTSFAVSVTELSAADPSEQPEASGQVFEDPVKKPLPSESVSHWPASTSSGTHSSTANLVGSNKGLASIQSSPDLESKIKIYYDTIALRKQMTKVNPDLPLPQSSKRSETSSCSGYYHPTVPVAPASQMKAAEGALQMPPAHHLAPKLSLQLPIKPSEVGAIVVMDTTEDAFNDANLQQLVQPSTTTLIAPKNAPPSAAGQTPEVEMTGTQPSPPAAEFEEIEMTDADPSQSAAVGASDQDMDFETTDPRSTIPRRFDVQKAVKNPQIQQALQSESLQQTLQKCAPNPPNTTAPFSDQAMTGLPQLTTHQTSLWSNTQTSNFPASMLRSSTVVPQTDSTNILACALTRATKQISTAPAYGPGTQHASGANSLGIVSGTKPSTMPNQPFNLDLHATTTFMQYGCNPQNQQKKAQAPGNAQSVTNGKSNSSFQGTNQPSLVDSHANTSFMQYGCNPKSQQKKIQAAGSTQSVANGYAKNSVEVAIRSTNGDQNPKDLIVTPQPPSKDPTSDISNRAFTDAKKAQVHLDPSKCTAFGTGKSYLSGSGSQYAPSTATATPEAPSNTTMTASYVPPPSAVSPPFKVPTTASATSLEYKPPTTSSNKGKQRAAAEVNEAGGSSASNTAQPFPAATANSKEAPARQGAQQLIPTVKKQPKFKHGPWLYVANGTPIEQFVHVEGCKVQLVPRTKMTYVRHRWVNEDEGRYWLAENGEWALRHPELVASFPELKDAVNAAIAKYLDSASF